MNTKIKIIKNNVQKIIRGYQKYGWFCRLFIIFIFAVILNNLIVIHANISSDELEKIYSIEDNMTYVYLPQSSISQSNLSPTDLGSVVWSITQWFGSTPTQICFENTGSYLKYGNKILYDAVTTKVSYNKGDFFNVNNLVCVQPPQNDNKFTFQWQFLVDMSVYDIIQESKDNLAVNTSISTYLKPIGSATMHPEVKTFIVLGGWGYEILKFILVFLSAGALLWAWSRTIVLIRDGLK